MKTHLSLVFLAALATLTGCSGNDDPVQPTSEAIGFYATVPNTKRSAPTTTATLKSFNVYAFTDGNPLMKNVKVSREGGSWTYSPLVYWPVTPVNFYAYSPDIAQSPDITGTGPGHIAGYQNDGRTDLLYSVKTGVSHQLSPVGLNFRHAFSKVTLMLSSNNPGITIKVKHISINNVYCQGSFNFPDGSTDADSVQNVGTWTSLGLISSPLIFYAIEDSDEVTLTSTPTDYTLGNLDVSYIIPQALVDAQLTGSNYSGTFFQVDCEIFDTMSGAKLWPNSKTPASQLVQDTETGRLMFAAKTSDVTEWKIGHSYIYKVSIDNPDVLDAIQFNPSVEDYSDINTDLQ